MTLFEKRTAEFSEDRKYRYRLDIRWGDGQLVNFLMLNPSTADEHKNDPTVERCCRRAVAWGYGGLIVTNLFAWRSTDPRALKKVDRPIGSPANDFHIMAAALDSARVICAWGIHGTIANRAAMVTAMLRRERVRLYALRLTKHGQPEHPLYIPYGDPVHW